MEEIKKWLDNPSDYITGRDLYNAYAPRYRKNDIIATQINSFDNSTSFNFLKSELKAILALIPSPKQTTPVESMMFHSGAKAGDLPEDLKKLSDEIPLLYKMRDKLRYESREEDPGERLGEMALQIVEYDQQIRRHYKVLDFYQRTGNYPPGWEDPEAYEKGMVSKLTYWLKAQRSFPSWISRNKNNPDKVEELKRKRAVLREIDQFLKNADQQIEHTEP